MTGQPQLSESGKQRMSTQPLSEPQAEMTSTHLEIGKLGRKCMHMHILISLCVHEYTNTSTTRVLQHIPCPHVPSNLVLGL